MDWLKVNEAARRLGRPERSLRYDLEKGKVPGIKDEDRNWHVPPAVVGASEPCITVDGADKHQVMRLNVDDRGQAIVHLLPGRVAARFVPDSGYSPQVFVTAQSGVAFIQAQHNTSSVGYLWLTHPF